MIQHPGHRSGATRLVVGGALVAALGVASTAWACTPQATSVAAFNGVAVAPGSFVKISGTVYTHGVVDGDAAADADPAVAPVPVEIRAGANADEAAVGPLVATATGPSYDVQLQLDTPGYYFFYAFARKMDGTLYPRTSPLAFRVVAPGVEPGGSSGRGP